MLIIGITGGTGCGKTTALQQVEALGGCVIDCDEVYHGLLESGGPMVEAICARFPAATAGGGFDRKSLGRVVFQDPEGLQALSDMTAPFVVEAVQAILDAAEAEGCELAAVDAIGLCESGLQDLCDTTVAVLAPEEVRAARLMAREGISEEYARLRIQAQKSNADFAAMCEHVLMNDCASAEEFGGKCSRFFMELLKEKGTGSDV